MTNIKIFATSFSSSSPSDKMSLFKTLECSYDCNIKNSWPGDGIEAVNLVNPCNGNFLLQDTVTCSIKIFDIPTLRTNTTITHINIKSHQWRFWVLLQQITTIKQTSVSAVLVPQLRKKLQQLQHTYEVQPKYIFAPQVTLNCLTLEAGTGRFSRNVGNSSPIYAV